MNHLNGLTGAGGYPGPNTAQLAIEVEPINDINPRHWGGQGLLATGTDFVNNSNEVMNEYHMQRPRIGGGQGLLDNTFGHTNDLRRNEGNTWRSSRGRSRSQRMVGRTRNDRGGRGSRNDRGGRGARGGRDNRGFDEPRGGFRGSRGNFRGTRDNFRGTRGSGRRSRRGRGEQRDSPWNPKNNLRPQARNHNMNGPPYNGPDINNKATGRNMTSGNVNGIVYWENQIKIMGDRAWKAYEKLESHKWVMGPQITLGLKSTAESVKSELVDLVRDHLITQNLIKGISMEEHVEKQEETDLDSTLECLHARQRSAKKVTNK